MEYMSMTIFVIFCFIASAIVIALAYSFFISTQVKDWQKTRGVIEKASVALMRSKFGDCPYDVATYSYSVNGKLYSNDKIRLSFFSGPSVEYPLKNYKVGQSVNIFYNPKNPSQSVLELAKKQDSFIPALLLIGFVAATGILLVMKYGYGN